MTCYWNPTASVFLSSFGQCQSKSLPQVSFGLWCTWYEVPFIQQHL